MAAWVVAAVACCGDMFNLPEDEIGKSSHAKPQASQRPLWQDSSTSLFSFRMIFDAQHRAAK